MELTKFFRMAMWFELSEGPKDPMLNLIEAKFQSLPSAVQIAEPGGDKLHKSFRLLGMPGFWHRCKIF